MSYASPIIECPCGYKTKNEYEFENHTCFSMPSSTSFSAPPGFQVPPPRPSPAAASSSSSAYSDLTPNQKFKMLERFFKCNRCNVGSLNRGGLRMHYATVHPNQQNESAECVYCKEKFTTLDEYIKHLEQQFICEESPCHDTAKASLDKCQKQKGGSIHNKFSSSASFNASTGFQMPRPYPAGASSSSSSSTKASAPPPANSNREPFNGFCHSEAKQKFETNPSDYFKCPLCEKSYVLAESLTGHFTREHYKAHSPKFVGSYSPMLSCPYCNKEFDTARKLIEHLEAPARLNREPSLPNTGYFKCDLCNQNYKNSKTLKAHITQVHGYGQSSCPHCKMVFSSPTTLSNHLINNLNANNACHPSIQLCLEEERRRRQNPLQSGARPSQAHASSSSSSSTSFNASTGFQMPRPYPAAASSSSSSSTKASAPPPANSNRELLNGFCDSEAKQKFETNPSDYFKCFECGEGFELAMSLKAHFTRLHYNNSYPPLNDRFKKPICLYCNKVFTTASDVIKHLESPTLFTKQPDLPSTGYFKCYICKKISKNSEDLRKHIAYTFLHGNTPNCPHCGNEFKTFQEVLTHLINNLNANNACHPSIKSCLEEEWRRCQNPLHSGARPRQAHASSSSSSSTSFSAPPGFQAPPPPAATSSIFMKELVCPLCNEKIADSVSNKQQGEHILMTHLKTRHPGLKLKAFACKYCGLKLFVPLTANNRTDTNEIERKYLEHIKEAHKKIECGICRETLSIYDEKMTSVLRKHMQNKHPALQAFYCEECHITSFDGKCMCEKNRAQKRPATPLYEARHVISPPPALYCPDCGATSDKDFICFCATNKAQKRPATPEPQVRDVRGNYNCNNPGCRAQFTSASDLKDHSYKFDDCMRYNFSTICDTDELFEG